MSLEVKMVGPEYDGLKEPEEKKTTTYGRDSDSIEKLLDLNKKLDRSPYVVSLSWYPEIKLIRTPEQIDEILKVLSNDSHRYTGLIISKLIRNSYKAGYNNFLLNHQKPLDNIGYRIKGTPDTPIILVNNGDVGEDCGYASRYAEIINLGSTGAGCANRAKNCLIINHERTGIMCGQDAEDCKIINFGYSGDFCGRYAKKTTIVNHSNTGKDCAKSAINCTIINKQSVGTDCGRSAKNTKITNYGYVRGYNDYIDTSGLARSARNCVIRLYRNISDVGKNAKNCVFETVQLPETYKDRNLRYEALKRTIPPSNTVVLIGEDGKEIERTQL